MRRVSDRTWNAAVGYLAAVVFAGIAGFALGATFSAGCPLDPQNAPFGCAEFLLSRYQTMIAAAIAAVAVFPVWRQVRLQGMQTDILKSDALRHRISTLNKMRDDLAGQTELVRQELQWYPDHIKTLSFWAHDTASRVDRFLDFLSEQKALRLDGERVALARADLIGKLTSLSRDLWVMNWDVYLDGEDAPDEEQQAKLQAEATAAEASLETNIGATLRSVNDLNAAILDDIAHARTKLHALSESFVSQDG
ncbi:hypothetical protein BwSF12_43790 [Bradyrhizobium ottawaense]|nr:hypothetical protein BwSH14_12190 [Bradyrhizobium ottawaense]GMO30537.1 hypothetical protein BwSF21_32210 [Bradyrhizobium ottawaense]GMO41005.1 hypothetical protein BwSF12_43790 [Bradyrhizobium ottawaense]GMO54086.1 hypothetical protein BwSG20_00360 [Bradyrhizobium ottawaense]GMO76469.1 hypothetical protein BwSH17_43100 [Bradyrhizobium ottawaense]